MALAAVNALVGGCAATRYALRFTDVPEFFERPVPQPNSLDIDDIVGHRVYDELRSIYSVAFAVTPCACTPVSHLDHFLSFRPRQVNVWSRN